MIGSLTLFSPGSIQSYGTSLIPSVTPQGAPNDAQAAQKPAGFGSAASGLGASGFGGTGARLAGATLLAAQEQGQSAGKTETGDLSEEEQAQVAKLKQVDAKVRAHERAHAAVGGAHAGAPSYTYTRGPDGQMYATGGEVAIDISAESDPEATLQKATQVAAAALAPADPSGQDRAVAAAAAQLRLEALAQIREQKRAEQEAQQEAPGDGGEAPDRSGQAHQRIGRLVGLIA